MKVVPAAAPLREFRKGVWLKESWLRFSGFTLQTRMTVIQLAQGLLLHSPSPAQVTAELQRELAELGTVRYLLAPNEIHNVGLVAFQAAYPNAHTTGCVGHPRRVKHARFDLLLGTDSTPGEVPWLAGGELEFHVIRGNRLLHEVALFHRPSKTLILTDAVEIIDEAAHLAPPLPSAPLRAVLRWAGFQFGAPCMSPEHQALCRDPEALRASLSVLEAWDFEALVIAHGRLTQGEAARRALREAFQHTIDVAKRRSAPARLLWATLARLEGGD